MPGKSTRWTSRHKRDSASRKNKLFRWMLFLAVLVLMLRIFSGIVSNAPQPAFHDGSCPEENGSETDSSYFRFLQAMLGYTIPGLEPPPLAAREEVYGMALDAFRSLTGVDPRDPRSFLDAELGGGGMLSLPVFLPPPGSYPAIPEEPEDDTGPGVPDNGLSEPVILFPFPLHDYEDPVILVYHTHITESFVPDSGVEYTENPELNVARLGEELVKLLRDNYGLPVLHDRQIFDIPRNLAYEKARPAIGEVLSDNPQVEVVVDLHRDGVARDITTTVFQGHPMGKVLMVVGTGHPGWETNFRFALRLQQELEAVAPGLSRGIRQYRFRYNQDLHPHALLIEVGGHLNTLEEAMLTIPYLAEALARTYYIFCGGN